MHPFYWRSFANFIVDAYLIPSSMYRIGLRKNRHTGCYVSVDSCVEKWNNSEVLAESNIIKKDSSIEMQFRKDLPVIKFM